MNVKGWNHNPYRLHDSRWFSNGTPKPLVCDDGVESQDPPPNTPFTGQLEPLVETAPTNGDDLRRDDSEDADDEMFDLNAALGGVWDAFGASGGD
jgi:hypothetical protein